MHASSCHQLYIFVLQEAHEGVEMEMEMAMARGDGAFGGSSAANNQCGWEERERGRAEACRFLGLLWFVDGRPALRSRMIGRGII